MTENPLADTITLRFEGHLTALAPLATCPPGLTRGNNEPAPVPVMSVNGIPRPYFPGPGLRGTLRRKAVDATRYGLAGTGASPFTLDDHYYLVLGGVKGDGKEDKVDLVNAHARRLANPVVGLFGSGDPWQKGHLYVGHAIPTVPVRVDVVRGARVDDFARSGESLQLLEPEERAAWLEIAKDNNIRSNKTKDMKKSEAEAKKPDTPPDEKKRLDALAKTLKAEIEEMNKVADYTNSVNRPLDGYETIPAGTEMMHEMHLVHGTVDEVGLLMAALRFWALDPWIGAHKAHGCGVVSGTWAVTLRKGHDLAFEPLGTVTMTPFSGVEGPALLMDAEARFFAALAAADGRFDFRYPGQAA